jgi:hypothetical protein
MIGRFLTGRTNHLDVASARLTSAGKIEIIDSPSRVNPAAPKCPHQFREMGGLFCCPVFDEFRGQNRIETGVSGIRSEFSDGELTSLGCRYSFLTLRTP